MKIVGISGGGSGSGKTSLVTAFLGVLPGWGALKTSPGRDYEIVTDPRKLLSPGTDTRRYIDAGAARAAWLLARAPLRPDAAAEALAAFAGCAGLLIEGGSLAEPFSPARRYVVVRAGAAAVKPAALSAIERADGVVANVPRGTPAEDETRLLEAIARAAARTPVFRIDVMQRDDPGWTRLAGEIRAWARR